MRHVPQLPPATDTNVTICNVVSCFAVASQADLPCTRHPGRGGERKRLRETEHRERESGSKSKMMARTAAPGGQPLSGVVLRASDAARSFTLDAAMWDHSACKVSLAPGRPHSGAGAMLRPQGTSGRPRASDTIFATPHIYARFGARVRARHAYLAFAFQS